MDYAKEATWRLAETELAAGEFAEQSAKWIASARKLRALSLKRHGGKRSVRDGAVRYHAEQARLNARCAWMAARAGR